MGWFIFGGDITNGEKGEPRGRPLGAKDKGPRKPKGTKATKPKKTEG